MNSIILISLLIIFSSFVITTFLDKRYSFFKLSGFLLFYYSLILLFAFLATKFLKVNNSKVIGSVFGFMVSLLLWNRFGDYAKVKY